jgi:hypothetical protein
MEPFFRRLLMCLAPALLGLALALAPGASAQAPGPGAPQAAAGVESTLKNMLSALQSGSVADFVASGDASFKAGMTQPMLDQVRSQLAPRLSLGYTPTFLGTLNQHGYTVYLWKLQFKDGKDDLLVTMAMSGGKVAGFLLQ